LSIETIKSSRLKTKTCYDQIVKALKTHNYYRQKPAVDLVVSNGPDQVFALDDEQQVVLGRNILQSADGGESSASKFLNDLPDMVTEWPVDLIRGIFLELFVNEEHKIRFKDSLVSEVFCAVSSLDDHERDDLVADLISLIVTGSLKRGVDEEDFEKSRDVIELHSWAEPLKVCLEARVVSLLLEEDED